ncbi:MAG: serine protease [Lachnospiraceae bacterium]
MIKRVMKSLLMGMVTMSLLSDPICVGAVSPVTILGEDEADMETAEGNCLFASVYVDVDPYMGSGFIIDVTDFYIYIMTNRHVAEKNKSNPMIVFADGTRVAARFVRADKQDDIAVLRVDRRDVHDALEDRLQSVVFRENRTAVKPGERIGIVARNVNQSVYMSDGEVEAASYDCYFTGEGMIEGMLGTYASKGGTSGSAVLDSRGYLVGIHKGTTTNGYAFFLTADKVWDEYTEVHQDAKEMEILIDRSGDVEQRPGEVGENQGNT